MITTETSMKQKVILVWPCERFFCDILAARDVDRIFINFYFCLQCAITQLYQPAVNSFMFSCSCSLPALMFSLLAKVESALSYSLQLQFVCHASLLEEFGRSHLLVQLPFHQTYLWFIISCRSMSMAHSACANTMLASFMMRRWTSLNISEWQFLGWTLYDCAFFWSWNWKIEQALQSFPPFSIAELQSLSTQMLPPSDFSNKGYTSGCCRWLFYWQRMVFKLTKSVWIVFFSI